MKKLCILILIIISTSCIHRKYVEYKRPLETHQNKPLPAYHDQKIFWDFFTYPNRYMAHNRFHKYKGTRYTYDAKIKFKEEKPSINVH